eukprot:8345567-Alexandrium_andersonii.AAC.1
MGTALQSGGSPGTGTSGLISPGSLLRASCPSKCVKSAAVPPWKWSLRAKSRRPISMETPWLTSLRGEASPLGGAGALWWAGCQ